MKIVKASIWNVVRWGKITPPAGSPRRGKPPTPAELELAGLDRTRQALVLRLMGEHPEIEPDYWWDLVSKYEDYRGRLPPFDALKLR